MLLNISNKFISLVGYYAGACMKIIEDIIIFIIRVIFNITIDENDLIFLNRFAYNNCR